MDHKMMTSQNIVFDPELIRRFDISGPRYTSYPTADRFVEACGSDASLAHLKGREVGGTRGGSKPLSLYVHIPFCNTICYYCACNKIITKNRNRSAKYIAYVEKEIAMQAAVLGGTHDAVQLHLGGGTPTFLSHDELRQLMAAIRRHFRLLPHGEYSIEVDPRKVDDATVQLLGELGFNRMSVGIQDFDPAVQKAVNRIQSLEETQQVIQAARKHGFLSINADLIYGLPLQNISSFEKTLKQVIALSPDRISLYNYAYLPALVKAQRYINESELPDPGTKLRLLQHAIQLLTDAGYVYIGMDHFAKPEDELAIAQRQGLLHRNFQGYSIHANSDLLSFGVSSISAVGPSYMQNHKSLDEYYEALDRNELPVLRGTELNADDLLRRTVIQSLMCQFELSIESLEISHLIDFKSYFAAELEALGEMQSSGLVSITSSCITVEPAGRLLVRAITMVFDRHLRRDQERKRYSKII
jgi:oxygen-independent coproporphyrinogen-3 oxidase